MNALEWSKSEVDYGRKLMDSALEGARSGERKFLKDDRLGRHLERSVLHALGPMMLGAGLGWLSGRLQDRRSKNKAFALGLLGGVIGLGTSLMWENWKLTASVASGAWKNITKTRDEHWFEKNPIDYA